jgi:hypothetical protein
MARVFSFERDVLATLDLVPLTVRRKLDLAGVKVGLEAWQALPLAERRAMADADVEDDASVAVFAQAVRAAAARAGATITPLANAGPHPWRSPVAPPIVRERIAGLGAALDDARWASLDDDARYALVHLSKDAQREERLHLALYELGVLVV